MQIWQPLVQAALQRGDLSEELYQRFAWQVLLGRDRSINAFALPGGYLGVHTGLIGAVAHRDELATVLAHELSHVTQRHIARMFAEEKKNIPLLIGGLVLGALAASSSPDAAQALIIGGQAAAVQNQLSFSRDMEREADRVGFNLLSPAGFNPQGAASMFDKLQQASRLNDNGSWPYLRSHPLTSERIADMQARVPHGSGAPLQTQWEDAMMSARARVLSQPGVDRLRQWVAQPGQSDFAQQPAAQRAAILYAAAQASQQLRDTAGAHAFWRQLDALVPASDAAARRQSAWLGAELALAAGQPQQALDLVERHPAPQLRPGPAGLAAPSAGQRAPANLGHHPPAGCAGLRQPLPGLAGTKSAPAGLAGTGRGAGGHSRLQRRARPLEGRARPGPARRQSRPHRSLDHRHPLAGRDRITAGRSAQAVSQSPSHRPNTAAPPKPPPKNR